jgi:hypothetical protein
MKVCLASVGLLVRVDMLRWVAFAGVFMLASLSLWCNESGVQILDFPPELQFLDKEDTGLFAGLAISASIKLLQDEDDGGCPAQIAFMRAFGHG